MVLTGTALAIAGDFNGDNVVDLFDLGVFTDQWLSSGTADVNDDNSVDNFDYAVLPNNWLKAGLPDTVSFWELEGDFTDSSGNGHNGTGNGVDFTVGHCGLSGRFDAGADYISVPMAGVARSAGTLALWFKMASTTENSYYFGHTTETSGYSNRIQVKTGQSASKNGLKIGLGATADVFGDVFQIAANNWYHIAITWQENVPGSGDGSTGPGQGFPPRAAP